MSFRLSNVVNNFVNNAFYSTHFNFFKWVFNVFILGSRYFYIYDSFTHSIRPKVSASTRLIYLNAQASRPTDRHKDIQREMKTDRWTQRETYLFVDLCHVQFGFYHHHNDSKHSEDERIVWDPFPLLEQNLSSTKSILNVRPRRPLPQHPASIGPPALVIYLRCLGGIGRMTPSRIRGHVG